MFGWYTLILQRLCKQAFQRKKTMAPMESNEEEEENALYLK